VQGPPRADPRSHAAGESAAGRGGRNPNSLHAHGDTGIDGARGDVYVVLHVTEHPFFERDGKDLHCAIPISITQAALGAKVSIPTLEGEATLEIPAGTQSGTNFRVRKRAFRCSTVAGAATCMWK